MSERVLLMDCKGNVREFYLESHQDKDLIIIAEKSEVAPPTDRVEEVAEPSPIKKKIFKFHHFGLTKTPVYYEVKIT